MTKTSSGMPIYPSAFVLICMTTFLDLLFLYTHYFHPDLSVGILVFFAIVCCVYTQLILGFIALTSYESFYTITPWVT